jgi:hypothetical protein
LPLLPRWKHEQCGLLERLHRIGRSDFHLRVLCGRRRYRVPSNSPAAA